MRTCLKDPIPELFDAARYLDAAVSAHLDGDGDLADRLIRKADMAPVRDWTESLWGKGGPWTRPLPVADQPPKLPKAERVPVRMPTAEERLALLRRDGHHCRFCGLPVLDRRVREALRRHYPAALPWGRRNVEQHAAFQALWLQYDHVLPHARGGGNGLDNVVITCAPCNFGRTDLTLAEAGLCDPRDRPPVRSTWDGLERLLRPPPRGVPTVACS